MARPVAANLRLIFTAATDSNPTIIKCDAVITDLYTQGYKCAYGPGHSSTDESTDVKGIMALPEITTLIKNEASDICNAWHRAGLDVPEPDFNLSEDACDQIIDIARRMPAGDWSPMDNVRLWNEAQDDVYIR